MIFKPSIHQQILKKCIKASPKILSSTTVFNIDNNEMFLEQQISILRFEDYNIKIENNGC